MNRIVYKNEHNVIWGNEHYIIWGNEQDGPIKEPYIRRKRGKKLFIAA